MAVSAASTRGVSDSEALAAPCPHHGESDTRFDGENSAVVRFILSAGTGSISAF
jgi:hypothetical protein